MAEVPAFEDCSPGVRAVGFAAIIAMQPTSEKVGNLYIPDSEKAKREIVEMRSRLVSLGGAAFDYAHFAEPPVKEGDPVLISHLAGKAFTGGDGKSYRICQDRDIIGVLEE